MQPSKIVHLDVYREKRDARLRRTLALQGIEPEGRELLLILSRAVSLTGGDRGAVVWQDSFDSSLVHPEAVLDLASDRPRRSFPFAPLAAAWDSGVPGLVDLTGLEGRVGRDGDGVKSLCAVAIGSDGPRFWYLFVDSLTPRAPLSRDVAGDLMFLAGEAASVVLHRDLEWVDSDDGPAPAGMGDAEEQVTAFAGWTVLRDIETRKDDETASHAISGRFLVARLVLGLLEDGFVVAPESLEHQVTGIRSHLESVEIPGPEWGCWERVLTAVESDDRTALMDALLEWGRVVEAQGHFHGAGEIFRVAFELGVADLVVEGAIEAARYQGLIARKNAAWGRATHWYEVARGMAEGAGCVSSLARVLDGLGNTFRDRGNLPRAREVLQQAMTLGLRHDDRYAVAIARHDLMTVEKLAGRLEEAIVHGWEAVRAYESTEGSLRALFDLAGVLRESGELVAARDAYTVVERQVEGFEYRILALDALAFIAALLGDEKEHRQLQARMDASGWQEVPHVYRAQVLYFRGLSARALGREEEARGWLEKALACAEEHGLNKLLFDVEEALAGSGPDLPVADRKSALPNPTPEEILGVRQGLRDLREALAVSV